MPYMQAAVEAMNYAGQLDRVRRRSPEEWDEVFGGEPSARSVVEVMERALDYQVDDGLRRYIEAWPPALAQGLLAAIHDALRSHQRVSVIWAPAYDFELRMWQALPGDTPGGLVIEFSGPYPGDVPATAT